MGGIGKEKRGIDDDILQCKANVLRAKDIIPPFGRKKDSDQEAFSEVKQPLMPINEEIKPVQPPKAPVEIRSIPEFEEIMPASAGQDIPRFNLAEQILAEQRKVSSSRRRKPGQKTQISSTLTEEPVSLPPIVARASPASPQQRIIADIVARDIEEMVTKRSQPKL